MKKILILTITALLVLAMSANAQKMASYPYKYSSRFDTERMRFNSEEETIRIIGGDVYKHLIFQYNELNNILEEGKHIFNTLYDIIDTMKTIPMDYEKVIKIDEENKIIYKLVIHNYVPYFHLETHQLWFLSVRFTDKNNFETAYNNIMYNVNYVKEKELEKQQTLKKETLAGQNLTSALSELF